MKRGIDFARKRKKWVRVLAALGLTSYGVYRVYHFPSVAEKRRRILKLFGVFVSVAEAASESAETIGIVSKDLKEFLQSDSDRIPRSLRQISKITRSNEFTESLSRATEAVTAGTLKGYRSETRSDGRNESSVNSGFADRVMDKVFSTAGSGFASVVVGSFARNLVMGFFADEQSAGGSNSNHSSNLDHFGSETNSVPQWVNVVCGDKCRELIGDCIQLFVSTAVAVYLDKTMDVNFYDELFSGLTNSKHEKKVRDVLVSVCNGAVETFVKTSHQVLTNPTLNENPSSVNSHCYLAIEEGAALSTTEDRKQEALSTGIEGTNGECEEKSDSGWVSKVSSTLAVPSNRRFVLDVTGRVTFETVRSFLEFLLEKLYEAAKRCKNIVHEAVVDKGLEIVRYTSMKSSVVASICVSLCLHILGGAWVLVPA